MTKSTRRALLSSVVALVICLTMLIGTTFAWFTDTASTAVNTIQSGILDVDLVDEDGNSLEGKTLSFVNVRGEDDILWEPGCTFYTEGFNVVNNGNLALKYQVVVTGIKGDAELLDVIEFKLVKKSDDGTYVPAGDDDLADALMPKGEDGSTSEVLYLEGHMDEDANNDYQDKTLENIAITVVATQVDYEYDSVSNEYDKNAPMPSVWDGKTTVEPSINNEDGKYHITTAEEFVSFITTVSAGGKYCHKTISIDADINLNGYVIKTTAEQANRQLDGVKIEGNNHVISNFTIDNTANPNDYYGGLFGYMAGYHESYIKDLTVENATVIGGKQTGVIIGGINGENSTVENCKVYSSTVIGTKKVGTVVGYTANGIVKDCYAENCTVYCAESNVTEAGEVVGFINTVDAGCTNKTSNNTFENVTVHFNVAPTLVSTADELAAALIDTTNAGNQPARTIILTADIDGSDWTAINTGSNYPAVEIYGNGHTIKNLAQPLFSSLPARDFVFDGINFTNVNITTSANAGLGVIVGEAMSNGGMSYTITNCHVNGGKIYSDVESDAGKYVGAFIGRIDGPVTVAMTDCTVTDVELNTFKSVGGLIGYAYGGTMNISVENCAVKGNTSVTSREDRTGTTATAGKLFGTLNINVNATIKNCTVDSTVTLSNTGATPAHEYVGRSLNGSTYTID